MAKKPGRNGKNGRSAAGTTAARNGDPELDRLEQIFQLMRKNDVQELEWEKGGNRLRVRCQGAETSVSTVAHQSHPAHVVEAPLHAAPVAATVSPGAQSSTQKQITSPFVGTFYRASSPTAEPYVREGQMVKRGDVLCIIEAMKLMNEIEAEASGRIVSVLVENGQPVEFGEPLFILEPAL